jgi:hypothetical protein
MGLVIEDTERSMEECGKLAMRTIREIPAGTRFKVPRYQRGYRWGQYQVEALLNDLLEAQREGVETYFLQPLTLRRLAADEFEVIDGQQRLTTLFLLKHYLSCRYQDKAQIFSQVGIEPISEVPYSINYDTRSKSWEFLQGLPAGKPVTVDQHFMRRSYDCIANWDGDDDTTRFIPPNSKPRSSTDSKGTPGLADWDRFITENVRLIWYEVGEEVDGQKLFLNLNRGRISLSNSELIKALLLSHVDGGLRDDESEKEAREVEITTQWDEMEQALHEPDFWAFLGGDIGSGRGEMPRMEYLFDLLNPRDKDEDARNRFRTYVAYDKRIKEFRAETTPGKTDLGVFVRQELWREKIRSPFLRLREWYLDSEYYHKIGFLIAIQDKESAELIGQLLERAQGQSKADFIREIDLRIVKAIGYAEETDGGLEFDEDLVNRLSYGKHNDSLNMLLLHNCLYCWRPLHDDSGRAGFTAGWERFSFRRDCDDSGWSLEHVNPQSEKSIHTRYARFDPAGARRWLERHRRFLPLLRPVDSEEKGNLEIKVDSLLSPEPFTEEEFQSLRDPIVRKFGRDFYDEGDDAVDRIGNLALLGLKANIKLGDGVFAQKREAILRMIADGEFVPPCTRRLFLKAFVHQQDDELVRQRSFAFWSRSDAEAYCSEIEQYLRLLRENLEDATSVVKLAADGRTEP